MNEPGNKELISKAKEGDVDAFAVVFEALRPFAYSVAYRLVGANDANDVLMETYLKAWKALPNFNERAALKTWLYRITHNCAQDFLRKRVRENKRFVKQDNDAEPIIDNLADAKQNSPSESLEKVETKDIMNKALDKLAEEHKVTLLLRFTDNLSYTEIAAATGVSIGTVMSRLFNGKRKLKKIIKSMDVDDNY